MKTIYRNLIFSILLAALVILNSCVTGVKETRVGKQEPPEEKKLSRLLEPEALIPIDGDLTVGRLQNGLTYYIRENAQPENRAELRLVVNAGSVLEDENQLGLAHFLEHMAFNGTKSFEKQIGRAHV